MTQKLPSSIWKLNAGYFPLRGRIGRHAESARQCQRYDRREGRIIDLENEYDIKVFYLDNLKALKSLQPDLIFFAPPPDLAPSIIHNELLEYFTWLREQKTALPEIYAYPPVPRGKAYQDVLGEDVRVVNIIPNDIRVIAGQAVKAEKSITATLATFASTWPENSLRRFRDFFAPLGGVLELKPSELIPVLGGRVISNTQAELCIELEKLLKVQGNEIGFQQIAGYMRAVLQRETGYQPLGKHGPAAWMRLKASLPNCWLK